MRWRKDIPPPINYDRYCPLVSVDGQQDTDQNAFGLICYSFKYIKEFNTMAYVRYLNTKNAPDNLYIGSKINLYEGNKLVATGEIIQESDYEFQY